MTLSGTEDTTLLLQKDETACAFEFTVAATQLNSSDFFCVGDKQKISRVLSTALHMLRTLE